MTDLQTNVAALQLAPTTVGFTGGPATPPARSRSNSSTVSAPAAAPAATHRGMPQGWTYDGSKIVDTVTGKEYSRGDFDFDTTTGIWKLKSTGQTISNIHGRLTSPALAAALAGAKLKSAPSPATPPALSRSNSSAGSANGAPTANVIPGSKGWVKGDGQAKSLFKTRAQTVLATVTLQKSIKLTAEYARLAQERDVLIEAQKDLAQDLLDLNIKFDPATSGYQTAKDRLATAASVLAQEDARLDAIEKKLDAERLAFSAHEATYTEKEQEADDILASKKGSLYSGAVKKVGNDTDIPALREHIIKKLIDEETELLTVPARRSQLQSEEATLQSERAKRADLEAQRQAAETEFTSKFSTFEADAKAAEAAKEKAKRELAETKRNLEPIEQDISKIEGTKAANKAEVKATKAHLDSLGSLTPPPASPKATPPASPKATPPASPKATPPASPKATPPSSPKAAASTPVDLDGLGIVPNVALNSGGSAAVDSGGNPSSDGDSGSNGGVNSAAATATPTFAEYKSFARQNFKGRQATDVKNFTTADEYQEYFSKNSITFS